MVLPFFSFNVSGQHTEDKKQRQTDRIPYFFITAFLLLPESDGSGMHKFDPAPQTLLLVLFNEQAACHFAAVTMEHPHKARRAKRPLIKGVHEG
jgi:hypothetical protein